MFLGVLDLFPVEEGPVHAVQNHSAVRMKGQQIGMFSRLTSNLFS